VEACARPPPPGSSERAGLIASTFRIASPTVPSSPAGGAVTSGSINLHSRSATGVFTIYHFRLPINGAGYFADTGIKVVGGVAHIAELGLRPTGAALERPAPGP
jgi:hypothetical protein